MEAAVTVVVEGRTRRAIDAFGMTTLADGHREELDAGAEPQRRQIATQGEFSIHERSIFPVLA